MCKSGRLRRGEKRDHLRLFVIWYAQILSREGTKLPQIVNNSDFLKGQSADTRYCGLSLDKHYHVIIWKLNNNSVWTFLKDSMIWMELGRWKPLSEFSPQYLHIFWSSLPSLDIPLFVDTTLVGPLILDRLRDGPLWDVEQFGKRTDLSSQNETWSGIDGTAESRDERD